MFDEMPDPHAGDEEAWEAVYCRAREDGDDDLALELACLLRTAAVYAQKPPVSSDERSEQAEVTDRIATLERLFA